MLAVSQMKNWVSMCLSVCEKQKERERERETSVIVSSSTREDELNCNVKDTQSLMNTQTFVCERVSE